MDYFLPSIEEASALTGLDRNSVPEEISAALKGLGFTQHVIKLGEKGCYVSLGEFTGIYAPKPVDRIIDTTGAGDSFTAGFLYGLWNGYPAARCIGCAQEMAARCIGQKGAAFKESMTIDSNVILRTC